MVPVVNQNFPATMKYRGSQSQARLAMAEDQLGLLQVYTGDGKGKTTAALGLALRAWGRGLKVCIIQFMKKGEDYGEILALRRLEGVELYQFGSDRLITKSSIHPEDIELAHRALALAEGALASAEYDVIILDEINVALFFGLVSPAEVLSSLRKRSEDVEVILTGRNAPPEILEEADLVTRMVAEKHPYDKGVMARAGIEF
jgi:cob(I)alamin adenosyltransferase